MTDLTGKKALVVGVANANSIAWGCARAFHEAGAQVALTYLNEKAKPHVAPLAESIGAQLLMPLNVESDAELDAVFARLGAEWGRLDIVLHSLAFAPRDDLQGRVLDTSRAGFGLAMDISVHSFIRMAKRAEPLMRAGGALMTVSFHGAERVVSTYNMMGPVKAALEATTRELASELGPMGIRVHTLSPGPVATRAASGIKDFDAMIEAATGRAPLGRLVTIAECGALAAFLASDGAAGMTGGLHYVDGGFNIMG
jgi:enoyl-[acyl-carrier protein] reductase I